MRSEKPICAPPRLSEVSPTEQCQCLSDWRRPFLRRSESSEASTPLSSMRSMVWSLSQTRSSVRIQTSVGRTGKDRSLALYVQESNPGYWTDKIQTQKRFKRRLFIRERRLRLYLWWSLCTLHFTRMPGESYCRRLKSLLYWCCVLFRVLIFFFSFCVDSAIFIRTGRTCEFSG